MREVDGHPVITTAKVTELLVTEGVERSATDEAIAGDIVAVAGIPEIMIGDTLADPDHAHALPRITVDEPAISVTIGTNTSPLAGKVSGHKLTARMVKNRLDTELVGNVSIKVVDIGRPDAWEVQGRGELALAVLVEQMRREGFELTVGKAAGGHPHHRRQAARAVRGDDHRLPRGVRRCDHPADGRPQGPHGGDDQPRRRVGPDGLHRAQPRADRIPHRLPDADPRYRHRQRGVRRLSAVGGEIRARHTGSLVSDRSGTVTPFAMIQLADRGQFFVEPGDDTYEGRVVGINPRAEDLDINVTREKKLTNMRSSTADVMETLARRSNSGSNRRWSSAPRTNAWRSRRRSFGCARSSWTPPAGRGQGPGQGARMTGSPGRSIR